ncbi:MULTISPECIES: DUF3084 domain-containing protein [unclassified Leptolyngbya]|uniref:DUF3084 domain-containing protein n=1 Tax=unclassified Leptolyngbya TaxID=2650499 RepID=UPI0016880157|nr:MULTISPECIES: DUF3084 domain-containing protein [unclassified Leptolyngbya]MBD1912678.1 DUF3084 domain-containing protein [Leptolyngbya sp. FACHB-8]MBD2154699.1 DUF3084 domain-containing protein [Leptolyngbya sp. FACHB-16]
MTTGLVLIAAILILGAVIATVGDRLGMRVGKARLSLFNLRPRQTATLITILTGIVISAVTFGILFAISDQLRTGVFELEQIQDDLATAREQLDQARTEQEEVQSERDLALRQQQQARRRLQETNRELQQAIAQSQAREQRLKETSQRLSSTEAQLQQVDASFQEARGLLQSVTQQARQLRSEINQLQRDRNQQIAQREQEIAEREQEIAERDRQIAEREAQLSTLETQRTILTQAIADLDREFQGLRQGNVALLRNQPLSANLVRIVDPDSAPQVVRELLQNANRAALLRLIPGTTTVDRQVLAVTSNQVESLLNQLSDRQEYVVQVLSAGNYVVGEPCILAGEACIQVFISTALNELLFPSNAVLASSNLSPERLTAAQLTEQYYILIRTAQFRMRQAGVLTDTQLQIADGQPETVGRFFQALQELSGVVEVQARSRTPILTGGPNPIVVNLVARQNGQDLFSTESF